MSNAADYTTVLCDDAKLRGISGYEVAVALASVLAARNPTLAGKVLVAVRDTITALPITRIVTSAPIDLTNLQDVAHGPAH